jgi:serine/threonine protein kinase
MNPERWRKLNGLFHDVLGLDPSRREAFTAEACEGDEQLLQELESMIAHHEKAQSFIEQPAYTLAADALVQDDSDSLVGRLFGPYRIVSILGSGGMGLVYLAVDQALGRKVALKFLHLHLTEDKDRVGRFKQEARAASALNHPNILTVHQIGVLEGRQFIATEFVEGETLREIMNRSRMNLSRILDIVAQVASALSAAHAAGIVHRDIKPENIMVRPDGYVKVLDFGIAKLTDTALSDSDAITLMNTEEGTIIGTIRYMSPEQVRGLSVDARTDIWSLGVMLYEMVAESFPFEGETRSDVIAAILEREPPPLARSRDGAPQALEQIATKALTKARDERYQTSSELMSDLQRLKNEIESGHRIDEGTATKIDLTKDADENQQVVTPHIRRIGADRSTSSAEYIFSNIRRHKGVTLLVAVTLGIAVAGITFGLYKFSGISRAPNRFQTVSMTRITTGGRARGAAVSPDGKYIAYVRDDADRRSLWLRQVGTTSDIQVSSNTDAGALTFSPDGNHLYWINFFGELFRMPVLGGSKNLLLKRVDSFSLSPDGNRLAFTLRVNPVEANSWLMIANIDGSGEQKLASRKEPDAFKGGLAWSPNGKVILCGTGEVQMSVIEVEVENGAQRTVTSQNWNEIRALAWLSDGSGLLMLASEKGSLSAQVWQLSYPDGVVRRITNDFGDYAGLSLTADSRMLVSVQEGRDAHLWLVTDNKTASSKQLTSRAENYFGISWTPEGKMVYASDASGNWDVWSRASTGGEAKQLTVNASVNLLPSVSPDGRYIAFTSTRSGAANIWKMDIDGGNSKQLTHGQFDINATWSPDGKWLVYVHEDSGLPTLWKVPADGGDAVMLVDKPAGNPVYSPDGKLIACSYGNGKVAIIPSQGGDPVKVFDIPTPFIIEPGFQWTPDGSALTYVDTQERVSNIWSQPLDNGSPKKLTNFTSEEIISFAWSSDGKQLALARGVETGDVVLISDSK